MLGSARLAVVVPAFSEARLVGRTLARMPAIVDAIYVVDDAGYTHLIQPGPQFKEIARNVIENIHTASISGNPCHQEAFYTAPFFQGKAMYLRGEDFLYRIEERTATK